MNENKLRRLFPHATESFIERNKDRDNDTGSSDQSKPLDRQEVCKTQRGEKMVSKYRLSHCEVEFFAGHGKRMDEDNRRYVIKPILDAIVSLGLAHDDADITSEVTQRMDKDNADI
jgi:hypothetical protein